MGPPLPSNTLSLRLAFTLGDKAGAAALPEQDHQAAALRVCEVTKLVAAGSLVARAVVLPTPATLAAPDALPFDAWHLDTSSAVKAEFIYGTERTLCMRVLTYLGAPVDGVTACRLAMHTLEMLETAVCSTDAFQSRKNPPVEYSLYHALNAARTVAGIAKQALLAKLFAPKLTDAQIACPFDVASMDAYCAQKSPEPARMAAFAAQPFSKEKLKALFPALDAWLAQAHRIGYFVLLNYSPKISPCLVTSVADLQSKEARLRGALVPPGPAPPASAFALINYIHAERTFYNNYGDHAFKFSSELVGFVWDWLGMAAPISGLGFITVNGKLAAWLRGTPADVEATVPLFESALGVPEAIYTQQLTWTGH